MPSQGLGQWADQPLVSNQLIHEQVLSLEVQDFQISRVQISSESSRKAQGIFPLTVKGANLTEELQ